MSNDKKNTPVHGDEPSMAEILASVRRIVAEDKPADKPTDKPGDQGPAADRTVPENSVPGSEGPEKETSATGQPAAGKKANILQQLLARQNVDDDSGEEAEVDVLELVNPVSRAKDTTPAFGIPDSKPVEPALEATPVSGTPVNDTLANDGVSDERLSSAFTTWAQGPGEEQLRKLVREELRATIGAAIGKN